MTATLKKMVLGNQYTEDIYEQDGKEVGFEHVIKYDEGITVDHVLASGSLSY